MILDEIIERTKLDLEIRKKEITLDLLGRSLSSNPYAPRDVKPYLVSTKEEPVRIIAEVKKASPSKGIIKEDFDPLVIAQEYSKNGANAISVLTEPHYFQGNLEYLTAIRRYVPTPLLRKDFIVDKYQIVEALVYGADFILLIAKALEVEPDNMAYVDTLAWGEYKLQNCNEAFIQMKRVVDEIGTDDYDIKLHWDKIKECKE